MKYVAETPRLRLRELTVEDADFAYELNLDPEVIRYTGDESFPDLDAAREFLTRYDHYRKYGFGRWGVELKDTGELLGWCGLKFSVDLNEYDLGFRFHRRNWNRGFATESAWVCLELGFKQFNMPQIVGRAARENHASIRVLQKVGMKFLREDVCHEHDAVVLSISREEFH